MEAAEVAAVALLVVLVLWLLYSVYKREQFEESESSVKMIHIFLLYAVSGIIENAFLNGLMERSETFSALKTPIHQPSFGPNKTLRGIVAYPLLNLGLSLLTPWLWNWSWMEALSIGYAGRVWWSLGELPNSWIKRKLGISAGECKSWLQWAGDHCDSSLALLLYLCSVHRFNFFTLCAILPLAAAGHYGVACFKAKKPQVASEKTPAPKKT